MVKKEYPVQFEVEAVSAMFTRPDTGSSFVSYPAPTYSAVKGMFESVVRLKSAFIKPQKIEICRPVKFHQYTTNYGGPLRKNKGASYQLGAMILTDVCYRVYGVVENIDDYYVDVKGNKINHRHYLQDKFNRRMRQGRFFYTPCLGWKEFTPSYFGEFREGTECIKTINEFIPSMLYSPFDKHSDGEKNSIFKSAWIKEGVLEYD